MNKKITTIVFDQGRVLLDFTPEKVLAPFFPDRSDCDLVDSVVFGSGEWDDMDAGKFTEDEALARWTVALPERLRPALARMFAEWHLQMTPIDGMTELICELKANGYRIYLLSNTSMRFFTYWEKVEMLRLMDGHLISAEHRLMKPDRAIYERLFEVFAIDPAESFFVDDLEENVEVGRKLGMRGFVFSSADVDALRCAMRQEGVQI